MAYFTLRSSTGALASAMASRTAAAAHTLRRQILTSCTPYVPYRTGALASSGSVTDNGVQWTAGHARKCYYARTPFRKEKHPLACAGWFEAAKAVDFEVWQQTAAGALTRKEI